MENNIFNQYQLFITMHSINTKMEGLQSINTSTRLNTRCRKNASVKGSVCEKCFAETYLNMRKHLNLNCEHNTQVLTDSIIPMEYLPFINQYVFRFESFGDLNNEIQFINYLNICYKNPQTTFAIWSKNPDIMDQVFNEMKYKKPNNLIIVISSLFLNVEFKLENMPYSKRYWFIDKIFTVYTCEYAIKNNININCGRKKCLNCKLCYSHNKVKIINEVLKSQQPLYYYIMDLLKDFKEYLKENEFKPNKEAINLYLSYIWYDILEEKNLDIKKAEKESKKIEKLLSKYIEVL